MRIVDAMFYRAIDTRSGQEDRLVVLVDRLLKSGKYEEAVLTPEEARRLAMRLLMAAERATGGRVDSW